MKDLEGDGGIHGGRLSQGSKHNQPKVECSDILFSVLTNNACRRIRVQN